MGRRQETALVAAASALVFTRVFGMSVVLPNFRDHAATITADAVLIGTALSAYGLTLAGMQLPLGSLSDRWGRRPVLLLGSLLFVAGSVWAALADGITMLIAARLMQGLGAISSVAMAMVGESVPTDRRTTAMAFVGIPAGGGFMVGMVTGPLLEPSVGVPGLFWLTAAGGALATLPLLWIRPAAARRTTTVRPPRAALGLAAAGFAANFALITVLFFLPFRGLPLVAMLVGALAAMLLASRQIDRSGHTWGPAVVGLGILVTGAALLLAPGLLAWVGGAVFFGAHATLSAVLPSQVTRVSGSSAGRGHGIQSVVAYTGTFVAGPLAGLTGRLDMAVSVVAAVALVGAAGVWLTRSEPS